jgi:predicted RecA/RadA family phage recombinase
MLMRAIAAKPAVGIGAADTHPACSVGGTVATIEAAAAGDSSRSGAFFLPMQQGGTGAQQLHLHVSVGKVSLLAKEKGFRASMRAAEAAQAFAAPVSPLNLCAQQGIPPLAWFEPLAHVGRVELCTHMNTPPKHFARKS